MHCLPWWDWLEDLYGKLFVIFGTVVSFEYTRSPERFVIGMKLPSMSANLLVGSFVAEFENAWTASILELGGDHDSASGRVQSFSSTCTTSIVRPRLFADTTSWYVHGLKRTMGLTLQINQHSMELTGLTFVSGFLFLSFFQLKV